MRRREFITLVGGVALPKLMRGPALKQRRGLRVSTNIDVVQEHDDIMYPQVVLFLLIHVGCVGAIWSGVTWQAIAICMVLYWSRMFAIGAGYHRYFSHQPYSTTRLFQFILSFLSHTNAQQTI